MPGIVRLSAIHQPQTSLVHSTPSLVRGYDSCSHPPSAGFGYWAGCCNHSRTLTHCPLGDVAVILKIWFSNSLYRIISQALAAKLLSGKWTHCILTWTGHSWSSVFCCLTQWGWEKMAAILQMTFWSVFSRMKMYEFRFKFHWSVQHSSIGSDNGLAPTRWQAIIWTNGG